MIKIGTPPIQNQLVGILAMGHLNQVLTSLLWIIVSSNIKTARSSVGFPIRGYPIKVTTLEFQIDHTVGKNLHGWKNDVDSGARATEMCPDIKAIGIWLSAIEHL